MKNQSRLDVSKFSFSQRTINVWNKLSTECVHASSVNMFNNIVDKYSKGGLHIEYLYLYTIFDQRRLDIIDQVEHGRSPQQVTHLPPVWDLLLPLA